MKKTFVSAQKRGKKPQRKISVISGWWDRLLDFCQANRGTKTNDDIYDLTKISRRTFAKAQRSNEFTEYILNDVVATLGLKNRRSLLEILNGDQEQKIIDSPQKGSNNEPPATELRGTKSLADWFRGLSLLKIRRYMAAIDYSTSKKRRELLARVLDPECVYVVSEKLASSTLKIGRASCRERV